MTPRALPVALAALIALAACPKPDTTTEAAPEPAPAPAPEPAEDDGVRADMAEHFGISVTTLSAVIQGDLDEAKRSQAELAELDTANLPAPWRRYLGPMTEAAAAGADATSLPEAATALAAVGRACGDCHAATGGGPKLVGAPPHQDWDPEGEMMRHQWAASLMWLGLTAPSKDSWRAGADALSTQPIAPDVAINDVTMAKYSGYEKAVHEAATAARDVEDWDRAQDHYAGLITLCSTCHTLVQQDQAADPPTKQ